MPTVPASRFASSLLAISRSISFIGRNPLKSKSSIYLTIAASLSLVSFLLLNRVSARGVTPLS